MKRFFSLCIPLLLCTFTFSQKPVYGQSILPEKRVILLLADGLSLDHISKEATPHLYQLANQGSVGMMSTNTAGGDSEEAAYATIGAGNKVTAEKQSSLSYDRNEMLIQPDEYQAVLAKDLYERNLGKPVRGEIVFPYVMPLINANQSLPYRFQIGWLGEQIRKIGGKTAVLGNSDWGGEVYRLAPLIAMDSEGQVDTGKVGKELLLPDSSQPFGVRTDYDQLYRYYQQVGKPSTLTVIETGDMLRLRGEKEQMDGDVIKKVYEENLSRLDQWIGRLLPEVDPHTLLIVASPRSFADMGIGKQDMTPLFMAGGEMKEKGVLCSNTTKIKGLVTNYDLAPTVLSFLGGTIPDEYVLGQPMTSVESGEPSLARLEQWSSQWELPNQTRTMVLRPYVEILIGMLVLGWIGFQWNRRLLHVVSNMLDHLLLVPFSLLLVPLFRPVTAFASTLCFFFIAAVLVAGISFLPARKHRLLAISGITTGALLLDMCFGSTGIRNSLLGYDVIGGARYYGIGNEYMGILIGASLLLVYMLLDLFPTHRRKILAFSALLFTGITYLLAAPQFGTNAGGALAAVIGYSYFICLMAPLQTKGRKGWVVGVATVLGFTVLLILNTAIPNGEQTHIGRAGIELLQGDFQGIASIIQRKAEVNIHLLAVSLWGKLFLVTLLTVSFFAFAPRPLKKVTVDPLWKKGLLTALVTGLAAFALNDSGVVAAAGVLLFMAVPMLDSQPPSLSSLEKKGRKRVEAS